MMCRIIFLFAWMVFALGIFTADQHSLPHFKIERALAQIGPIPGMPPPFVAVCSAAVTLDAKNSAGHYASSTTTTGDLTIQTIGVGTSRALIALEGWSTNPGTVTAIWDDGSSNQGLTQQQLTNAGAGGSGFVGIYTLLNPVSGNKNLKVSWTNSTSDNFTSSISFTNLSHFINQTPAQGTATSLNLTPGSSTINAAVVIGTAANTSSMNQTSIYSPGTGGSVVNSSSAYNIGTASPTFTLTAGGSAQIIMAGIVGSC